MGFMAAAMEEDGLIQRSMEAEEQWDRERQQKKTKGTSDKQQIKHLF